MKHILADFHLHSDFLPFTYTKPLAELRMGILSFRERWNRFSGKLFESSGEEYLLPKYPCSKEGDLLVICASLIPSEPLFEEIQQLNSGEKASGRTESFWRTGLKNCSRWNRLRHSIV